MSEWVSPRHIQVLQGVAEGLTDEAIAKQLHLAPATVKQYVASARGVLGCSTRASAVHVAHRWKLINDGGCDSRVEHPAHWFGALSHKWCTGERRAPSDDPAPF